ncbi:MAG: hypothetical protein CEE38_07360 [Planctomycetes bacterium B3_Pla]|nr:MAG: hypothetical protein CEE38_07360 [Planctomycetes bacterium B3_Pla]
MTYENKFCSPDFVSDMRSTVLARRHIRRRGIVLVWTAIFILLIILFFGLMIDTAKVAYNLHELQNATDAAALAGALVVKAQSPDAARQKAYDIGFANAVEGLGMTLSMTPLQTSLAPDTDPFTEDEAPYDILVGRWVRYNRTFVPTLDAPNAVKVFGRRNAALGDNLRPPLQMRFGPIAGVNTADVAAVAIAFNASSGGAGLIVLSDLPNQGAEIGATAKLDIDGGGIHINSTSMGNNNFAGAWIHGSPVLDAGFLNVVGTVSPPPDDSAWEAIFADAQAAGEAGGYPVMDYMDGIQHIDDPLAAAMIAEGEPYVVSTGDYAGMHLNLPDLLENDILTWYAGWNSSSSGYDLVDDPDNPSVYMQWNGLSYESVVVDSAFVPSDSGVFRDTTVGKVIVKNTVTDPNTGEITYTYTGGNLDVTVSLPPGYYPNGMTIQNGDAINLEPVEGVSRADKLFLFGGGQTPGNNNIGLYMTGGTLTGHGVTCYVTETFDSDGAALGVAGVTKITGGVVDLDSPGDWTNQQAELLGQPVDMSLVEGINGIAIWQDPDMSVPSPEAHLNGNGDFILSGTIYFPDPIHLRLEGDLGDTGNQILCGTASILGTARISVNYDGRNYGISTAISYLVR